MSVGRSVGVVEICGNGLAIQNMFVQPEIGTRLHQATVPVHTICCQDSARTLAVSLWLG